jgi:tRNA threonylcarbamoyladenosine biosynthesis protein TsaB
LPFDQPLILGFDTSAAHCAAVLLSGDRIIAGLAEDMSKGQAERLVPLLQEVLAKAGASWNDLNALGVGIGPGNFTGIRISVATARGLAMGLDIAAVGVSGFEALAFGTTRPFATLIDAPRAQVYRQDYLEDECLAPRLQLRLDADAETAHAGLATPAPLPPLVLAERIARIAATRWQTKSASPAPLYMRPADAAPARDAPPVILAS